MAGQLLVCLHLLPADSLQVALQLVVGALQLLGLILVVLNLLFHLDLDVLQLLAPLAVFRKHRLPALRFFCFRLESFLQLFAFCQKFHVVLLGVAQICAQMLIF